MEGYAFALLLAGLLIITSFSVFAARAQAALWRECRRRDSCLRTQQLITLGKSHCR